MPRSNTAIFPVIRTAFEDFKQQASLFDKQREEASLAQQRVQATQGRVQQAQALIDLLATQSIEQALNNEAIDLLNSNQARHDQPLMLQAQPMSDTVWSIAVVVADLANSVPAPTDRPLKVWIFDPKRRLGNQHDLSEQFLRVGDVLPGIVQEHGILSQLMVDVLTGLVVFHSTHPMAFPKDLSKEVITETTEVPAEETAPVVEELPTIYEDTLPTEPPTDNVD